MTLFVNEKNPALSTFSTAWKEGRHKNEKWTKEIPVAVTTLDALIREFGTPRFCKIDVEGFEDRVLQGLHSPIPHLSFEFLKENIDSIKSCMERLDSLGKTAYTYTDENTASFVTPWSGPEKLLEHIAGRAEEDLSGDIHVRMEPKKDEPS
jgi:hypothetical protein